MPELAGGAKVRKGELVFSYEEELTGDKKEKREETT